MALECWVGSILQKTTTGNQAYTPAGLDFTPKTLIFFAPNRTSDGSAAAFLLGMGAAVSTSSRFGVSISSADAAANSNTDRASGNDRCLTLYNGATLGAADLVSFDTNGFTLNWLTTDGTARVWNVIALGGSDLTDVAIAQLTSPTTTGNVDFTSLSFQPDCILPFTIGSSTAATGGANAIFGTGFGTASNQASLGVSSEDSQGTTDSERTQDTVPVINSSFNGVRFLVAQLVSMLSNGFRLNWTTVQGTGRICWVLCLKGGSYKVGTFNQATGTGVTSYSLTTFTPTGIIVGSFNNVTSSAITASARVSIGAASGASERGCIWSGDSDNVGDSIADQDLDRTKLIKMLTEGTPTVDAAGDLSAFNSDGISIDWTTADATARECIYLALGSTPAKSLVPKQRGINALLVR